MTTNPTGGAGAIAIVDAYDLHGTAAGDLATFDTQFGVAGATFTIIYQNAGACTAGVGAAPPPAQDYGWDLEEDLDIEWAHAMAPSAHLYLVEANSNSYSDLFAAEAIATKCVQAYGAGMVSNSWGGGDFSGETSYDSYFNNSGVVYLASSGDSPGVEYPSASPNVIGVGGTTFTRNQTTGVFEGEVPWNDDYYGIGSGGGASSYESRPAFQNAIASVVGSSRGVADLGGPADPEAGAWVYSTTYFGGWGFVGGTSWASPTLAGIMNREGYFFTSSTAALNYFYALGTGGALGNLLTNVNTGACGVANQYNPQYIRRTAAPTPFPVTWNWCTGWGTWNGQE